MKVLVIRHAIAEEREAFAESGKSDDERPLTANGRRRMERAARGLHTLVPRINLLASSPLVRAQQTAAVVAKVFRTEVGEETASLSPGASLDQFAKWLAPHAELDVIAVVGHEPHLSALVTWLLSGLSDSRIEFKKGGACLLELDGQPGPAAAKLHWLLTPKALRQLTD
ncbi:MAG TPA: phosphohistidine phosphatase SixA [Gemmatimonadaceae bacterium]|nr:phosphohistidine phosphatase SixA [Gemmatimonadaceae bacterium]